MSRNSPTPVESIISILKGMDEQSARRFLRTLRETGDNEAARLEAKQEALARLSSDELGVHLQRLQGDPLRNMDEIKMVSNTLRDRLKSETADKPIGLGEDSYYNLLQKRSELTAQLQVAQLSPGKNIREIRRLNAELKQFNFEPDYIEKPAPKQEDNDND